MADSGELWWCIKCEEIVPSNHEHMSAIMPIPATCVAAIEARVIERCEKKRRADLKGWLKDAGTSEEEEVLQTGLAVKSYDLRALIPPKEAPK